MNGRAAGGCMAAAPSSGTGLLELSVQRGEGDKRQTFILRPGTVLRIGRSAGNDIVVDLDGVSSHHANLQRVLPSAEAPAEAGLPLCVRDESRNGTGVRPAPQGGNTEADWEKLTRGASKQLGHGWQLKVPCKSRQGAFQLPESSRTLTLYLAAAKPGDASETVGTPPKPVPPGVKRPQPPTQAQAEASTGATGSSSSKGAEVAPELPRAQVEAGVQPASTTSKRATVGVPAINKPGATAEAVAGAVVEALAGGRTERLAHVSPRADAPSGKEMPSAAASVQGTEVVVVKDEEPRRRGRPQQEVAAAAAARVPAPSPQSKAPVTVVEAEAARQAGARAKRGARRRPVGGDSLEDDGASSPEGDTPPPSARHTGGIHHESMATLVPKTNSFRRAEPHRLEGVPRDMSISPISEPGVGRKRKRRKPRESSEEKVEERGHQQPVKQKKAKKNDKADKVEKPPKVDKHEKLEKAEDRKTDDKKAKKKKRRPQEAGAKVDHPHQQSPPTQRARGGR